MLPVKPSRSENLDRSKVANSRDKSLLELFYRQYGWASCGLTRVGRQVMMGAGRCFDDGLQRLGQAAISIPTTLHSTGCQRTVKKVVDNRLICVMRSTNVLTPWRNLLFVVDGNSSHCYSATRLVVGQITAMGCSVIVVPEFVNKWTTKTFQVLSKSANVCLANFNTKRAKEEKSEAGQKQSIPFTRVQHAFTV